jgi:hypothetical protein
LDTQVQLREDFIINILPLRQEIYKLRFQSLILFDQHFNTTALSKRQNEKLHSLISTLAQACVDTDNNQEAEAIYNCYHEQNLDHFKKTSSQIFNLKWRISLVLILAGILIPKNLFGVLSMR